MTSRIAALIAFATLAAAGCATGPAMQSPRFGTVQARDRDGDNVDLCSSTVSGEHASCYVMIDPVTGNRVSVVQEDTTVGAGGQNGLLFFCRVNGSTGSTATVEEFAMCNVTTDGKLRVLDNDTYQELVNFHATLSNSTLLEGSAVGASPRVSLMGGIVRATPGLSSGVVDGDRQALTFDTTGNARVTFSGAPSVTISGTPTFNLGTIGGVATETTLADIEGDVDTLLTRTPGLGQTTMSGGSPVTFASNQTSPYFESTPLSAVASNVDGSSTAFDTRGYSEVLFEISFSSTGANAVGDFYFTGGFINTGLDTEERALHPTLLHTTDTTCFLSNDGLGNVNGIGVNFVAANGTGLCMVSIAQPPPHMLVRWDRFSGGSAAGANGLTVRAFGRAFSDGDDLPKDKAGRVRGTMVPDNLEMLTGFIDTPADTNPHQIIDDGYDDRTIITPFHVYVGSLMTGTVTINGVTLGAGMSATFYPQTLGDLVYQFSSTAATERFSFSAGTDVAVEE
jgi:hypothetical protein